VIEGDVNFQDQSHHAATGIAAVEVEILPNWAHAETRLLRHVIPVHCSVETLGVPPRSDHELSRICVEIFRQCHVS
jgi:hypothetical protein